MDSGVDISMKNPYPILTFVGFKNFSEADFVESTKEVIIDSKLDHHSLTNGLVLELWSLVEIQESGKIKSQKGSLLKLLVASSSSGRQMKRLPETLSRRWLIH